MQASSDNRTEVQVAASPSLTKQSLWILSAKTIGFGLSILLPLLVVRNLAQADVGLYRQAFLVIVTATSILPLGFSMSAYYFLNRERERRDSTVLNIVLFNFFAGAIAFLFLSAYPSILGSLFREDQMAALAPLVGLAIWLAIFSAFLETAALANKEAKLATGIIIFAQLSKAALMGGAALLFKSAEAIVLAAVVQGAGQTLVLIFFLRSRFPGFWRRFEWDFFKQHLRYALPFGFAALLYNAQADLHHYVVAREFSSADYAIYAYGCFQLPLIWALYESISAVLLPRMSELQSQGRTDEMLKIMVSGIRKLAFVYFPLFVFLIVVADVFVVTLFTSRFGDSAAIFRVNLLLLPLYCLILDPLERSFKELGTFLSKVRTLVVAGLAVTLYFGIDRLGLTGTIAIVVLFVSLERTISAWKVSRLMNFRLKDIGMLAGIARVALSAAIPGVMLILLLSTVGDRILGALVDGSRSLLASFGLNSGWEFLGGCVFLGLSGSLFGSAYLALAVRLNAIDEEDLERIARAFATVADRLQGVRGWLFGGRPVRPVVEQ